MKNLKFHIPYIAIIALMGILFLQDCRGDKKVTEKIDEIVEVTNKTSCDTIYIPGPTKTVYKDRIETKTETVVKWKEITVEDETRINQIIANYKSQIEEKERIISKLQQVAENNDFPIDVVVEPEKEYNYTDSIETEQYTFDYSIRSKGPIQEFRYKINPLTLIPLQNPIQPLYEEKEAKKRRHNFFALKTGILWMDRQRYHPITLQYGWRFLTIEGGPIMNQDFQFDAGVNYQAQAGLLFKF